MSEPTRHAIVREGNVENIVLWDGDAETWQAPEGTEAIACPDDASIGWSFVNGEWSPPLSPEE